jgi:anti-anti-sigma factor
MGEFARPPETALAAEAGSCLNSRRWMTTDKIAANRHRRKERGMRLRTVQEEPGLKILALSGSLDSLGVEDVGSDLIAEVEQADGDVILDISEVDFIASLGMTLLVKCAKMLAADQYVLVLCDAQPLVDEALRFGKVDSILDVAETLDEARSLLKLR